MKTVQTISMASTIFIWAVLIGYTAVEKSAVPLLVLILMHLTEIPLAGLPRGKASGFSPLRSIVLTLIFGVTWWGFLGKTRE